MEQNLTIAAKKVWNLMRVVFTMLQKGIPKRRLLLQLNMMIKRGKIVRKTLQNLMFHHHDCRPHDNHHLSFTSPPPGEYEDNLDIMEFNAAVVKAMGMIHSEAVSPVLPGFGMSPMVRQVRVTDSPFPLSNVDGDGHVDEAAGKFISRFYNDLRRENTKSLFGSR